MERGVTGPARDVFDPLPGEGRWETALLADGNIGIGGDPVALLRRLRAADRARTAAWSSTWRRRAPALTTGRVRLETEGGTSGPLPLGAGSGVDAIDAARRRGRARRGRDRTEHDGRWFAILERAA